MTEEMSRVQRLRSKKKTSQPTSKWKRYTKYTLLTLVTLGAAGTLAGVGAFTYYASSAPKVTNAALVGTSQTQYLDKNGDVFYTSGSQKREIAKQSEIPQEMRMAVVSIEDRRFYKHHGVDPRRILGAAFANFTGSSLGLQGGSTLTQQLIKLTVFSTATSDQTLKRKAQEAWLALKLEKQYSKNQILTLYMNKVYMGNGVYGMKTAADYYFGKSLDQLSTPQMALLAGLPQSPTGYDPYTNPKDAKNRRDEVLEAMAQNGVITQSKANEYMKTPIDDGLVSTHSDQLENTEEKTKINQAYITSVNAELKSLGYNPDTDGLTIQTNLEPKVQNRAYNIVNTENYVAWPDDEMQVGLTVTDPRNGDVIAQIGGRKETTLFGTNHATNTKRSSGSTAKPLVAYGPAIEDMNWSTNHAVDDNAYKYPGTNISVNDFDHRYLGTISMRTAIAQSRNIPAVQTLQEVGYDKSSAFLKKLGINEDPKEMVASNAIGIDISTEQEAAAYSAFANGGTYYKPSYISKITDRSGAVKKFSSKGSEAMKSSTAFMMTSMLKSVISDSYAKMIATDAYNQAGKTGTVAYGEDSNMSADSAMDTWFTGYTKSAAISVWTGYDDPNEVGHDLTGNEQYIMLKVYGALMDYVMSDSSMDGTDWTVPSTVKQVTVNGKKEYQVAGANVANEKTVGVASTSTPSYSSRSTSSSAPTVSSAMSSSSQPAESSSEASDSSSEPASSSTPASSSAQSSSSTPASSSSQERKQAE
ncbi:PBP1A family penicillin-binding protein [Weissella confusa]|uniref:PBP1A family penicillin-binding protein n=1 Tax=Weissella confusa TaxID=1583 RepID=UPI000DCA5B51|nr:PBP1A family penicillin-binding protein [Weissella confusa]MBJ7630812.1 PBP1A family penicillin-binding protein [Weissella confusa]MBJ7635237.1 PBP1A family penicillin-binding protein [Weissella confusa]RAU04549.1 carboxypeptidase [Weissella confusa]TGE43945.1 carboxypeptidase [Weissella confusa]TGE55808.1 carboxypeptidase [Weissella confusa]